MCIKPKPIFRSIWTFWAEGEIILLCKRNTPVAEIRAVVAARKTKRPIGLAKNKFKITQSFFKPLPDDLLDAFEGNS